MSQFSQEVYTKIFDQLLSAELSYSSSFASETNIHSAIKRVLGDSVKNGHISLYQDLQIAENLDITFKIKDPDGDVIPIHLVYDG